ncbi:MAG: hypothetical protein JW999_06025 [Methanotrichaceae archaeon]|nr:hypothetical protein [Methanotrichaceae archaeon]
MFPQSRAPEKRPVRRQAHLTPRPDRPPARGHDRLPGKPARPDDRRRLARTARPTGSARKCIYTEKGLWDETTSEFMMAWL